MQDVEFSIYDQLKKNQSDEILRVIISTNSDDITEKKKIIEQNGDALIIKPYSNKELIDLINTLLKRAEISENLDDKVSVLKQEEKTKILLIDDDPQIIKLFQFTFQKAGYQCKSCNSAKEALETIKSYIPDLIISDIMMPDIDGFEFREKLLNNPGTKNIPFLFLTSKSGE